ncbi:patatin-like phospholipase family protein [Sphingomonas sp.]|uniref:patatin-like phospholipase family protein n=1 Tax=Sphingomonas sp. TaxID=28214 RepID=UPI0028AB9465|nr:patatin-like phospholipase family protein [Sphingomonas sp.]
MTDLPRYSADMFQAPDKECDIVMKGGITSGLVYPYAVLELARVYRLRSIGGTSAGAIAAAFTAAAEYARIVRDDPAGFVRLQARCDALPGILAALFQPEPRFRALMQYLVRGQARGGSAWLWGLPRAFPLLSAVGLAGGAALLWLLRGGIAGILLGALVGLLVAIGSHLLRLVLRELPAAGFGFCTGRTVPGNQVPGLTDWLHDSLQEIAFGHDAKARDPLTFGDLIGPDPLAPLIDLRMITTNLSMRRPHTLPTLGVSTGFSLAEWRSLFPPHVIAFLGRVTKPFAQLAETQRFPEPADLPVVVATRMSLSFPLLFTAVPTYTRDIASYAIARATGAQAPQVRKARMWFADGGISSNFPIHLFDALFPARPTFALSLDELPEDAGSPNDRVFIPQRAGQGVGLPVRPITGLAGFAGSILGSAKDWQDQLLSTMPGQRERIARIFLSDREGGLNLAMPEDRSTALMGYGLQAGRQFAGGALDFDEHRWRRSLVAYEQLEQAVVGTEAVWSAGFGDWLAAYLDHPQSYKAVTMADRQNIHARLARFAGLAAAFRPLIAHKRRKFPRPAGRLRIGPDF